MASLHTIYMYIYVHIVLLCELVNKNLAISGRKQVLFPMYMDVQYHIFTAACYILVIDHREKMTNICWIGVQ